MGIRTRQNELKVMLIDDELYILERKLKQSGINSKSAFIRHLLLYGYVYDIDYSCLHEMNTLLANTSNNINQIAKRVNTTGNIYKEYLDEIKEIMEKYGIHKNPCCYNNHWQSNRLYMQLFFVIVQEFDHCPYKCHIPLFLKYAVN